MLTSKIMHILVVEDEVRLARVIVSALIKAGHDPVVIHDGELALQKAASESFDLIVLGFAANFFPQCP